MVNVQLTAIGKLKVARADLARFNGGGGFRQKVRVFEEVGRVTGVKCLSERLLGRHRFSKVEEYPV